MTIAVLVIPCHGLAIMRGEVMKATDLTPDEIWVYAPLYIRLPLRIFVVVLPLLPISF